MMTKLQSLGHFGGLIQQAPDKP